jgi:hypothetical protein
MKGLAGRPSAIADIGPPCDEPERAAAEHLPYEEVGKPIFGGGRWLVPHAAGGLFSRGLADEQETVSTAQATQTVKSGAANTGSPRRHARAETHDAVRLGTASAGWVVKLPIRSCTPLVFSVSN